MKRKLKDKTGATILIALLFFLMCAGTGSMILAAGSSASGRVASLASEEQTYYNVISAAETLRDELGYYKVTIKEDNGNISYNWDAYGELLPIMDKAVKEIQDGKDAYTDSITLSLVGNGKEEDNMDDVKGTFIMDSGMNITVSLYQGSNEDSYSCTLTMASSLTESSDGKTTQVNWTTPIIEKGQ